MTLPDEAERLRVLTDLGATLLVEAAAGTGKTSLIAGRVAMLLANGRAPKYVAAITFTELAAGELAQRIRSYVDALLSGKTPDVLVSALPAGLSPEQRAHLVAAHDRLDEITTSTIHGFCQDIIRSYAVETGLDPGSQVMDETSADAMFDTVFETWIMDRLSDPADTNNPVAVLSEDDPLTVVRLIRELADLKRRHSTACTVSPNLQARPDIDFVDAVAEFARWFASTPGEARTAAVIEDLQKLSAFFGRCLESMPSFRDLWRLAHPGHLSVMAAGESTELGRYACKASWKSKCGAEGERYNSEASQHFELVRTQYGNLRGQIADRLVRELSLALDEVLSAYNRRKRDAAALDFGDLLYFAFDLVTKHEVVRRALGGRYPYIFVDEFQDTDRVQAAIIFLIAAEARPSRWEEARIRPGALFLVGDPKQAIYRFRGADIEAYKKARAAIASQGPNAIVGITANFRSQKAIIDQVNRCFNPVLEGEGQPGYVPLASTVEAAEHGLPCASTFKINLPPNPSAAVQRDEEAAAVARICHRLVGSLRIRRPNGNVEYLNPGDIALLAPTGTELWRYEQALESAGLAVASQAGKTLFRQQETRDVLALLRALADPTDLLAFHAFLRGPMIGLTDEELLDIAEVVQAASPPHEFSIRTPLELVAHPLARSTLRTLQHLRRRASATTPRALLSEAIERLRLRVVLAARHRNRSARALANLDALIEMARPYDVAGLKAFVRNMQAAWEVGEPHREGRIDPSSDAIEIVTIHSSKGLEWPVVIPINTSTQFRSAAQFVHRKSDNTLHWVVGGVTPPAIAQARAGESLQDGLERERMWYVACTRARDLLIIPELPSAEPKTWARVLDLALHDLPQLSLDMLPEASARTEPIVVNDQTPENFAEEAITVETAAGRLHWRRPSDHDNDRAEVIEAAARSTDDSFEFQNPIGAGQVRGIVLHKLMEDLLTGELADNDIAVIEQRADELLEQLVGIQPERQTVLPEPTEMAATAFNTLRIPTVAGLRPVLMPEVPIWADLGGGEYLAGRADAIADQGDGNLIILDWKSDVSPGPTDRASHARQLADYLAATGSSMGALIYMTLGEVVWIERPGSR
jgi:ATP-dependent exoDNAse (exonuclease V) beta subunit